MNTDINDITYSGGTIIPFASGNAPLVSTNAMGISVNAALLAFHSNCHTVHLADDRTITLASEEQHAFSIPCNCTIKNIYATVGNWGNFAPPDGACVYPYILIYRATAGSNRFLPIPESKAIPDVCLNGYTPASTMLPISLTNVNIPLQAGDRLLITGLMQINGNCSLAQSYYLYFTGGIYLN